MPIAKISLLRGKPAAYRHAISASVHRALVEVAGIPEKDRFHLINELDPDNLLYDPGFLEIERTENIVIIEITMRVDRPRPVRVALLQKIAERLAQDPGLRAEDVFVTIVENDYANWSVGRGEAPLMSLLPLAGAKVG